MVPTEQEKRKQALIKARQARAREYAAVTEKAQGQINPLYGSNPFEPSAYLERVPSDPKLSEPLPSGRYIDHANFPTGTSLARAAEIEEFRADPRTWVEQNTTQLNNEQSLVEKSKSMMARVFNYRDPADAQFFGVDLSAAESVWDGFLRYFTGAYDLLNIGYGGLLSAAPGGLPTLTYDQLSGGKSVSQVLQGEMEPGSAPSPGQIAITSIALEAKRIREGNARLSDVLLLNPATAPFILAALAADTSPLQQDGFNIMDAQQREKAFSSGWEQWMSGITDAGLMFADPLIGVGVGIKVARAGLLGVPGGAKYSTELGVGLDNAVRALPNGEQQVTQLQELIDIGVSRQKAQETPEGIAKRIADNPTYDPTQYMEPVVYRASDPVPEFDNPLSGFLYKLHTVDDAGNRVMTPDMIARDPSFDGLTDKASVGDLLYESRSPAMSSLILQTMAGTPGALQKLSLLDAGIADVAFRYQREFYAARSIFTEPAKSKEVAEGLNARIQDTKSNIDVLDEQLRGVEGITDPMAQATARQGLDIKRKTLQQNLEELEELHAVATQGKAVDFLDPTSAFYRQDRADEIMASIMSNPQVTQQLVNSSLLDAASSARMFLPSRNNAYSRMVMDSRGRRQKARYEYAAEGTSIFPKKIITETIDGKPVRVSDGWFSESQFEGTSRFRRNIRVWRWLGAEVPSGFIGIKGTSTVGSEREFTAALDTDMYSGTGTLVERDVLVDGKPVVETFRDETGKTVTRIKRESKVYGGVAARDAYFRRFYAALNDPKVDTQKVLMDIEQDIMRDYAAVYGVSEDFMQNIWTTANRKREQNLALIRERGYFVDPESGDIQMVPYLDAQLANGTYMQNFRALETELKRHALGANREQFLAKIQIPANVAGSAYNLFNNFWRPLTLMRLAYTQRNIFEGTLRAMAYSASLSPLLWPVKATAFGARNQIVSRAVQKRLTQAAKRIDKSEYGRYLREYNEAAVDEYYWKGALEVVEAADAEPMMVFIGRDRQSRRMTVAEYDRELERVTQRVTDAQAALKENEQLFTDSIKGTAFGKWRDQNIKDLKQKVQESQAFRQSIEEAQNDLRANGFDGPIDDATLRQYAELIASESKNQMDLDALLYDPAKATAMYRTIAGRQKRIGSGKSMGPNGSYYDDAFTGPYDQINRALMSADNTITQQLSLRADIWNSLFYKTMVRENTAVAFTPATRQQWTRGMAQAIEEASSSWLIQSLVANGWDEAKTLAEMTSTKKGQIFLTRIMSLFGDSNLEKVAKTVDSPEEAAAKSAYVLDKQGKRTGLKAFAKEERTATGETQILVTDIDQARIFINEVANQVKSQMQGRQEFMSLLQRRAQDKARGAQLGVVSKKDVKDKKESFPGQAVSISEKDVEDALALIPAAEQERLGKIQGATIVRYGSDGFLNMWATLTSKIFKYLGQIPEDAITRGGFYNMQFKAARNTLIETYLRRSGQESAIKTGRARGASNREQGVTLNHDEFTIPQNELNRIFYQAHRQALKDTREWMYTIERRTNLGKYGEWIFPFISATQNTATVAGKLLYKEPWLAPMIIDLWRMPTRLGIEDENGNVLLPMPLDWVRKTLQDNPNIPVIGGVLDSADSIRIPKGGINMFMPETGFGVAPRPTPWVQVAASELMKANMFPVETPGLLKSMFGEEGGDEFYKTLKDYVFGEEQGASATFASLDKITPAYFQKLVQSRSELSAQYGYQFALQWNTQLMRFRGGERDNPPTEEEIHKRTTNTMWFALAGNFGVPTPLTPYPILTRPMIDSPVTVLQDYYQRLQQADPLTANLNMDRMFGEGMLDVAMTKVTRNVGGANPTPETVSDIETLAPLIRSLTPNLGQNDMGVLGILVNNRRAPAAFEQSAYNWQRAAKIPGTNQEWRQVQSPEEAVAERQRISGWTIYNQGLDQLEAMMKSAGVTSYESAAGRPYKEAKNRLQENLLSNPDYAGWIVDFQDRGGSKTLSAVRVLEEAVRDDTFRNLMIGNGKERLFGIMNEYVENRRLLLSALEQSGHSIEHDSNIVLKIAWDSMRLKWRNEDERWAEIDSLYLSGDRNPQSPGNLGLMREAEEAMIGVGQ